MKKKKKTTNVKKKELKNLDICNYWDLSTWHITRKDDVLLQDSCSFLPTAPMVVYPYEYGYWIHTCNEVEEKELKKFGFSKQFIAILLYAKTNGFRFIKLDRDGAEVAQLKKYKW